MVAISRLHSVKNNTQWFIDTLYKYLPVGTCLCPCYVFRKSHGRPPVASDSPVASVPIELQNIRPVSEEHDYAYILDPQGRGRYLI